MYKLVNMWNLLTKTRNIYRRILEKLIFGQIYMKCSCRGNVKNDRQAIDKISAKDEQTATGISVPLSK